MLVRANYFFAKLNVKQIDVNYQNITLIICEGDELLVKGKYFFRKEENIPRYWFPPSWIYSIYREIYFSVCKSFYFRSNFLVHLFDSCFLPSHDLPNAKRSSIFGLFFQRKLLCTVLSRLFYVSPDLFVQLESLSWAIFFHILYSVPAITIQ